MQHMPAQTLRNERLRLHQICKPAPQRCNWCVGSVRSQ